MIDKNIIIEYENILTGKKKEYATFLFTKNKYNNMDIALSIIKYSIDTYLKWNPLEVRDYLTKNIMILLKIDTLLKYIIFPPELNPDEDIFFIAWKLYPETIHYCQEDLILRVYKNILNGEIKRYPKEFFTGTEGYYRAAICLKYMIEQFIVVKDIEELYMIFGSKNINSTLKKYKLDVACKDLFCSPIDFLHNTLSDEQKVDLLASYYEFERLRNLKIKSLLKDGRGEV